MKRFLSLFTRTIDPADERQAIMEAIMPVKGDAVVSSAQQGADGAVVIVLEVDPAQGSALEPMRMAVQRAAEAVVGAKRRVQVVLTAEAKPAAPESKRAPAPPPPDVLAHVKRVVLVASGKGGVGKSTVAANLAMSLVKTGRSVGLLDADIYGPSQPRMMGIAGQKPDGVQGRIIPLMAHGVKVMSVGLMVDEGAALVWRGPIVQKALMQMLRDVEWGTAAEPMDILIVDMPPGTGDVPLSIAQKVPVAGAVIVSTPQDIALLDVRKGVSMFNTVGVPILGVIENMSTHICSACGHEDPIFGHGGARVEAERMGVPFLGEIPLSAHIRTQSDAGQPVEGVYDDVAARLVDVLNRD